MSTSGDRTSWELLVDRQFGSLFWGKLLSAAGVWTHNVVAAIAVYAMTGSALMAGLVTVSQASPQLVLTMLSGRMADQGDAVRQAIAGRIISAAGSGFLAVWLMLDISPGASWPFLVASLVVGLGFVLGGPALQSVVPALVSPDEFTRAMALNGLPLILARAAGPALGAAIGSQADPTVAFAFAAATHLAFAALIRAARLPRATVLTGDVDYSVMAALRFVWRDRRMFALMVAMGVVGFASEPSLSLAPALAAYVEASPHDAGLLPTTFGIGAILGFALRPVVSRLISIDALPGWGLLVMAVGLGACSLPSSLTVAATALLVCGVGFSVAMTSVTTLIQLRAPVELRGRVMALWLVAFLGVRPISAALLGLIADLSSVAVAMGATAVATVMTVWLVPPRQRRTSTRPADDSDAAPPPAA